LSTWQTNYGSLGVLFFSPQTDSAVNGSMAQIDGLTVVLKNGDIGNVNFEGSLSAGPGAAPVPLPAAAWSGMATLGGLGLAGRWKRRRAQNA
jgi:hypothetical protein